jgi:hypothetical protein
LIQIEVRAELARRNLNRLALSLGPARRGIANKRVAAKLTAMVLRNFDTESNDGEPWAALAPSTVEFKRREGKEKMLVMTSYMKQTFLPFSDADQAGTGARRATKENEDGDHADLALIHEKGTDKIPARPMLPTPERGLEEAVKIYSAYIREVNL